MRPTLTKKIGALLLLPLLGTLVGIGAVWHLMRQTRPHLHSLDHAGRLRMLSAELLAWAHMVSIGQEEDRDGLLQRVAAFDATLALLEKGGPTDEGTVPPAPSEVQEDLSRLRGLWREIRPDLMIVVAAPRTEPRFQEAFRRANSRLDSLRAGARRPIRTYDAWLDRQWDVILYVLVGIAGAMAAVFGLGLWVTRRHIVAPIFRMGDAAGRIGSGDFSRRLEVAGQDELGGLTRAFNDMADRVQQLVGALDLQRRHAETLIDSVPVGLLVLRPDLTIFRANRSFPEAAGRPVGDVLPAEGLRETAFEVLTTGETKRAAFETRERDGSMRRLRVTIAKTRVEEEDLLLLLVEDLTTQELLAEQMRAADRRYRDVVENTTDGIVLADVEGRITHVNRAAERMFGWTGAELVGKSLPVLVPEKYRSAHEAAVARLRSTGALEAPGAVHQLEGLRRDGTVFPIELILGAHRSRESTVLTGVVRDVTERREMAEQIRQAQKMEAVGQLAGGIAHDFNNLLTVITGYSDLLLNSLEEGDPMRRDVGEIRQAAERAATLTRQLLAFSRRQILQPRVVDLNALVRETESMLRRAIGEDVAIVLRLDSALGRARIDPGQIEQVILALAMNSRDAMPEGGTLALATANVEIDEAFVQTRPGSKAGPHTMLSVTDTGCGMTEEVRAHVFEPFFTTKGKGKGTGMGLATVYGIVKQSGGYVDFESEPGKGTTFRIYLPRVEGAPASTPGGLPAVPRRGAETVLLVEDEEVVRALVREVLRRGGYTVLDAGNGEEALRMNGTHAGAIDLILTDVVMPRMNGRELVRKLAPLRPKAKILYMSGYADHAILEDGAPEGAFLQKPFTPGALARKVREVLDAVVS